MMNKIALGVLIFCVVLMVCSMIYLIRYPWYHPKHQKMFGWLVSGFYGVVISMTLFVFGG